MSTRSLLVFSLQRGGAVIAATFGFGIGFMAMVLLWQLI